MKFGFSRNIWAAQDNEDENDWKEQVSLSHYFLNKVLPNRILNDLSNAYQEMTKVKPFADIQ